MAETYKITPTQKKCVYQIEHWVTQTSTSKKVKVLHTVYFRSGEFEIDLTEIEKREILKKEYIILNDYCACASEMWDSCDVFNEIENWEQYTEDELKEINILLYCFKRDDGTFDEDDELNYVDTSRLEENGWDLDDTIYGFDCGCEVKQIS